MTDTPRLLAVDDTTESLALVTAVLTSAGYDVLPADSGELALATVDGDPPDLILLAIRLKGMDGFEVCRRLKANENTRRIPIIFIGASADAADWATGLRLGAADYITMPFQPEQLLARVRTHLALSRADVTLEQQADALSRTNEDLRSEIAVRLGVEARLRESLDRAEQSRRAMLSTVEDQKRAEEQAAARALQQAAISELGKVAMTDPEFLVLADQATRRVAQVLDVELCTVLEIQPDCSALLKAGVGWQAGLVGRATVGLGQESQAGFTLDSKEPVIVEDLRTESRFRGPQLLHDHEAISGVSVVIGDPERPYGVLGAHSTRRRTFTVHDVHFLQGVAHLLAAAVRRQQAQAALGASERRLADSIDAAQLGTFDWDPDTGRIIWNARHAELFGLAIEAFDGTFDSFVQRVHPDDWVRLDQAITRSRQEPLSFHDERRVVWPDASVHWIAVSGRSSSDGRTGQEVRVRGVVWDITERKEAEARVSEQLDELRRWHQATLGREGRVLELKKEINDLLAQAGQPPRYPSVAAE